MQQNKYWISKSFCIFGDGNHIYLFFTGAF